MIYVSIDLETTGLDPDEDQVLMAALVVEDTKKAREVAVEDLPTFACLVRHEKYHGDAYALHLNHKLLGALAEPPQHQAPLLNDYSIPAYHTTTWEKVAAQWLRDQLGPVRRVNIAGKNAAGFDLQFLERHGPLLTMFRHRVIDPGSVFVDWDKDTLPSLDEIKRAYLDGSPVTHNAIEDARDVIRALRHCYV